MGEFGGEFGGEHRRPLGDPQHGRAVMSLSASAGRVASALNGEVS
jgi:hypothetical protein